MKTFIIKYLKSLKESLVTFDLFKDIKHILEVSKKDEISIKVRFEVPYSKILIDFYDSRKGLALRIYDDDAYSYGLRLYYKKLNKK